MWLLLRSHLGPTSSSFNKLSFVVLVLIAILVFFLLISGFLEARVPFDLAHSRRLRLLQGSVCSLGPLTIRRLLPLHRLSEHFLLNPFFEDVLDCNLLQLPSPQFHFLINAVIVRLHYILDGDSTGNYISKTAHPHVAVLLFLSTKDEQSLSCSEIKTIAVIIGQLVLNVSFR